MSVTERARTWVSTPADEVLVGRLSHETGLSPVATRILVSRGITTADAAARFLEPSLDRDWTTPSLIPGMEDAAKAVARSIVDRQRILVFGDFDLDGVSAAAVAARGLRAMGGQVDAIVPHRFTEGYGLSDAALKRIMLHAPDLVVTVDCGVSARAEVDALVGAGISVVVTDHHEPGDGVPRGVPVANPKLEAQGVGRDLAGAGVALKLIQAVGVILERTEVWEDLTDLAMLGTVADIVPLSEENRALVAHGVNRVREHPRPALKALCAVAGIDPEQFDSESVSYALAPRLNAAGRLADPQVSLDLLLADEEPQALVHAQALDELNRMRQEIESVLAAEAADVATRTYNGERALVLAGEGWHEGVKGIVASRLAKRFGVPTFLFSLEDGIARGSARSVGTVDLFSAVNGCAAVLDRFGGHEAAVGLTLDASRLDEFTSLLLARLDALPAEMFVTALRVDTSVQLGDVSVELGAELAQLGPFGQGNPRPMLMVPSVFMNDRSRVGRDAGHLRFTAFDGVASAPAIAFRCRDIEAMAAKDTHVDIAFELSVDEWRGRKRAQMLVRDLRDATARSEGPVADLVDELFEHADESLAREDYAGIGDAESFHTKLSGVTFDDRQETIAQLSPGDPLRLVREPDNPHDSNACAVHDARGRMLGFLNRRLASVLGPLLDQGAPYDIEVADLTGGEDGRSRGVNVRVSRRDVSQEAVELAQRREDRREHLRALADDALERELTDCFIGGGTLHFAQAQALESLAQGRNTLVVMATGRGKSLIFHMHAAREALKRGSASVFVYPLRALVADQSFHLSEAFAEVGLSVRTVTGETSAGERDDAFEELGSGRLDVVLTTPEFFYFHRDRFARAARVRFIVVDEAHHVGLSRAGHRPAYAQLGECVTALGGPTTLAVTATASDTVARSIRERLSIDNVVLDPTVRSNLEVVDARESKDKDALIARIVESGGKVVIYVNSRDASVRIARSLRKRSADIAWKTAFYNGGLSRSVRHAVERAFRSGDIRVVVATSAFGEGVNIPDIRDVVLYHLPFNDVEFNQMSGRAGRDGAPARIHLLFGDKDARINERILGSQAPSRDDLAGLYRALRELAQRHGDGFEITNAELASGAQKMGASIDERGVSSALGIMRELGLVTGEGYGALRRLTVVPQDGKVELSSSLRYAEAQQELDEFSDFRTWVLTSTAEELLARFNRPILPQNT